MIKKTYRVSDMHCSNCVIKIESLEDELPGVHSISASYIKGSMVVEFDETQINDAVIIAALKKQGYAANPV